MLTCDLSDYEGKVVDIIVAAKPKKSDVYCPIARIDNVAVYGLEGTFFTRLVDWNDGTDGSYKKAGVVLDYGMNSQKYVEPDTTNIDGEYFSGASKKIPNNTTTHKLKSENIGFFEIKVNVI